MSQWAWLMRHQGLCNPWSSWQPLIRAWLPFHRLQDRRARLCKEVLVLRYQILKHVDHCAFVSCRVGGSIWLQQHSVCVCKLLGANHSFQVNVLSWWPCYYQHSGKEWRCRLQYLDFGPRLELDLLGSCIPRKQFYLCRLRPQVLVLNISFLLHRVHVYSIGANLPGGPNKKAQLPLTNPRDACEKFARFT